MAEYIERSKEFIQGAIDCCNPSIRNAVRVRKYLEEQPAADVVEVVRCKDCRHYKRWIWSDGEIALYCDKHWGHPEAAPDDFCSYGERKYNNVQENEKL